MNDKETKIHETTEALKAYMAKGGGTNQSKIAKAIGTSPTVISQFLSGKYIGNVDKLTAQIDEFLAREEERTLHAEKSSPFVRTSQANDALSVLTFCHVHRQIGVIHAPAGLGKTVTLHHYARENSWVRIITCVAGMSRRDVLDEIVDALDLRLVRGASGKILKAILDALEGSEIILVFDEAQHLTLKHFETIRHTYDRLGTPVVFAGTNDIIDRMTGRKNVVYDQVFSRVGMKRQLKPAISKTDVAELAASAGVAHGRRDLCDYLYNIAKRAGYYRTMMGCLYTAKVIAKQKFESLEVAHLQTAEKLLWDGAQ
jgi:hypothetical protein